MAEYRIYRVDERGHISEPPQAVCCQTVADAVEIAYQLVDGQAVELWEGPRFILRLPVRE